MHTETVAIITVTNGKYLSLVSSHPIALVYPLPVR